MQRTFVVIVVLILVGVGTILFLPRRERRIPLLPSSAVVGNNAGNRAPDFTTSDFEGKSVSLSAFIGKPVFLDFWAAWCPFCLKEMEEIETLHKEFGDRAVFLGIHRTDTEDFATAVRFAKERGVTYALLRDNDGELYRTFAGGGQFMPLAFFIDGNGIIRQRLVGPKTIEQMRDGMQSFFTVQETKSSVGDGVSTKVLMTDGVQHTVPLDQILSGGPPKDSISSIDSPQFDSVEKANAYLRDNGIGVAVSFNGVDRFYPNQITVWHEIVNDMVGGQPVLVTYCPLCGTGIVFDPIVKGEPTEFGTSGKLYQSNLVMYDRQTDSYWSQILGEAIVGEMAGTKLKLLPYQNMSWKDWKREHPKGEVLSRETGYGRDYTRSPYGDYDTNRSIFFPVEHRDDRYHPKAPTYSLVDNGKFKAYPQEELEKTSGDFTDTFAGRTLRVQYKKANKTVVFTDTATGEDVVPFYGFWFSWIAVHPDTEVFLTQ